MATAAFRRQYLIRIRIMENLNIVPGDEHIRNCIFEWTS